MNRVSKILISFLLFIFLISVFCMGKAIASESLFKLTNAIITDKSENLDASISNFDDSKVETNVLFHNLNEFVTYKLTIKNTTD